MLSMGVSFRVPVVEEIGIKDTGDLVKGVFFSFSGLLVGILASRCMSIGGLNFSRVPFR